jgi:hypothetical protein
LLPQAGVTLRKSWSKLYSTFFLEVYFLALTLKAGQAHLPDPEMTTVKAVTLRRRAFNVKAIEQFQESQGQEGGLAPALPFAETNR